MQAYSTSDIILTLKKRNISLFTLSDFSRLFNLKNAHTIFKKIQRLEDKKIIHKIINGKYLFSLSNVDDFTIANFIVKPSYISLDSALSFYGILPQFPYQITSITIKSTKIFIYEKKEYYYSHIDCSLFWGYQKEEYFLIAEKEKALLDYIYFSLKGLRNALDTEEIDMSQFDKQKIKRYAKKWNNKQMLDILKKII